MDYDTARQFADTWGLLTMVLMFVGAIVWAMRPAARKYHDDAQMIPFREEEADQ